MMSQPTMRPDHMLMPSKKPTARSSAGEACVVMSMSPGVPSRRCKAGPRGTRLARPLLLERGVAELGVQVVDLGPVRHHRLGEGALAVQDFLEEGVLGRIAIQHDVGCAYELGEEVLRRV